MNRIFRFRNWSLRAKLAALLIAASLLPLGIMAYIEINERQAQLMRGTQNLLQARAEQLAREFDSIHAGYQHAVQRLARYPDTIEFCATRSRPRPAMNEEMQGILETLPGSDPNIRGAGVIDLAGHLALGTEAPVVGLDFSSRAIVRNALQGEAVISSVYISSPLTAQRPTVAYLMPVFDSGGKVLCAVGIWVHADAFWRELKAANSLAGPGSYAVVLDELGIRMGYTYDEEAVYHPTGPLPPVAVAAMTAEQRFGAHTRQLLGEIRAFPEEYERARAATPDPHVFRGYASVNQTWNYGVARRLRTVPWTVFYLVPEDDVQAQLARAAREKYLLVAGIMALACAVGLAFAANILRAISALAQATTALAEGDRTTRVIQHGNDELGKLGASFNAMVLRLREQEDALRRSRDQLEERVAQRTAELTRTAEELIAEGAERQEAQARQLKQLARLGLLDQITRAIGERQDLQSIYRVVVGSLEQRMPVDFCCVCAYDEACQRLTVTHIGARSHPLAKALGLAEHVRIPIDTDGLAHCLRGELTYEPAIGGSPFPFPRLLAQGGLRSLVLAPLMAGGGVFGVLAVARLAGSGFSSGECEFLRQLSDHVGLAVQQARLYDDLHRAYDELRQTQQAALQHERLSALGQMASGIAHDINNAISPIALYTENLLEQEPGLSERARGQLQVIARAIDDVAATVARMREFYRQREPGMDLLPIDLNLLAQQVIDLTRARWSDMPQQRGIVIDMRTDFTSALPAVMGVESEIREALTNLVFNAVDAMPEGGSITLRTRLSRRADGEAAVEQVVLEVVDTGLGMDEDTRRRCLEPFFTTKGERGTGLGLAMVYGMVQRYKLGIDIESAPGRGTTVRLSFEVTAGAAAAPAPAGGTPGLAAPMQVLLVDDDPLVLQSMYETLAADGHRVVRADGGQAGIDAFHAALGAARPFDLVMTDLGMPHVDGRHVAAAVKASSATPVILLTGWGQSLADDGGKPPHVDMLLGKPPKLDVLRAALRRFSAAPREDGPA